MPPWPWQGVLCVIFSRTLQAKLQVCVWVFTRLFYRVRLKGTKTCRPRAWRFWSPITSVGSDGLILLTYSLRLGANDHICPHIAGRWLGWLGRRTGVIPIDPPVAARS